MTHIAAAQQQQQQLAATKAMQLWLPWNTINTSGPHKQHVEKEVNMRAFSVMRTVLGHAWGKQATQQKRRQLIPRCGTLYELHEIVWQAQETEHSRPGGGVVLKWRSPERQCGHKRSLPSWAENLDRGRQTAWGAWAQLLRSGAAPSRSPSGPAQPRSASHSRFVSGLKPCWYSLFFQCQSFWHNNPNPDLPPSPTPGSPARPGSRDGNKNTLAIQ